MAEDRVERPDLAILYWFYKRPDATRNHLELLRAHNPGARIYGLYGGDPARRPQYTRLLRGLLDDFWTYRGTYGDDDYTKWLHGDLLVLDWYDKRGRDLAWDSLAVVQWDMLVFDDVRAILPELGRDQVFFSGYRDLDVRTQRDWEWTAPGGEYRRDFLRFRRWLEDTYGYTDLLKCCMYVFEVLTRPFLDGYLALPDKHIGMLEYKNPTLAHILGIDVHEWDVGLYWEDVVSPLKAGTENITGRYVSEQLARPGGWRMFHPYKIGWDAGDEGRPLPVVPTPHPPTPHPPTPHPPTTDPPAPGSG